MKNIKQLREQLENKKKESIEKKSVVSVRVTPEIGLMLKELSSEKIYDFKITGTFNKLFSEALAHQILAHYQARENGVAEFTQFLEIMVNHADYLPNNSAFDAVTVMLGENNSHVSDPSLVTFTNSPEYLTLVKFDSLSLQALLNEKFEK